MISFIEGNVEHLNDKFAIINAGGIGYKVHIVPKLQHILSKSNGKVKLFVHSQLNVRDGTFDMYGFDKKEDLELFHLLVSVSGIGPKNAQSIMSSVEPVNLKAAVVKNDAEYLKKASGLGPRMAQRLVVELKNKIDFLDLGDIKDIDLSQQGQAIEALTTLGYTPSQSKEVLKQVSNDKSLEEKVREALKILGKK